MKVLTFVRANPDLAGGAEIYLDRVSKALTKQGIKHQLMHSPLSKKLPSWLRVILFNIFAQIKKKDRFYFSLERITCPDIYRAGDGVHRVFLQGSNKSFLNPLHAVYLYLERRTFHNAKVIIANSMMVKRQIMQTYQISKDKIKVIYNGVKLKPCDANAAKQQVELDYSITLDSEKKVLLYVGSGFKRKGVFEFLTLLTKLKQSNYVAFVVGKDKRSDYYQQLASHLGLADKVIFTGVRQDIELFYAVSDIFILPTYYDPFSNAVLEAMSSQNAVITTSQTGACELLDTQFVMKTPEDYSIASRVDRLLADPQDLQQVKALNAQVASVYSIDKNVKETLEVISSIS